MIYSLFDMLITLLNQNKITASDLAEKLEVSTRTIYRYVDVISAANIPIVCERGKNGGVSIGQEFRLYSQFLTPQERKTLMSILDAIPPHLIIEMDKIKQKLLSISPEKMPTNYQNDNFVVDKTNWINDTKTKDKLDLIIKAKNECKGLEIYYSGRNSQASRIIYPYCIIFSKGIWYIYAYCTLRKTMRTFKVSRISKIFFTDITFEKQEYKQDWDLQNHQQYDTITVTLKVLEKARYDVEEWLGVEMLHQSDNGDYKLAQCQLPDNENTIAKLLSFGDNVQVLSPKTLIKSLTESCKKTLSIYDKSDME